MAYYSEDDHCKVSQLDLVAIAILYEADDKIRETYASRGQTNLRGLIEPIKDGPPKENPRMDQATDRCVAVAEVGDDLYVGTNGLSVTKHLVDLVRRDKNFVSKTTTKNINRGNIISADENGLNNFRQEVANGIGRILGYRRVHFIVGKATYLNNFHAEMQLLDWFMTKNITPNNRFIGVSKPCCPECTAILNLAGITHTSSHKKNAHVRKNVETHTKDFAQSFGGSFLHPHLDASALDNFRFRVSQAERKTQENPSST